MSEAVRAVEEFLAEKGDGLSAEERASLQRALSQVREQYSSLTDTAQTSLAQLDTHISATVQQNTQRVRSRPSPRFPLTAVRPSLSPTCPFPLLYEHPTYTASSPTGT